MPPRRREHFMRMQAAARQQVQAQLYRGPIPAIFNRMETNIRRRRNVLSDFTYARTRSGWTMTWFDIEARELNYVFWNATFPREVNWYSSLRGRFTTHYFN